MPEIAGSLADLILKFSTDKDVLLNTPKTEIFYINPRKQI